MKKNYHLFAIIFIFILANTLILFSQSNSPANVLHDQAASFLNLIPEGMEKEYGFQSREEFEKISLGEPFLLQALEFADSIDGTGSKISYVHIVNNKIWRVPIIVGTKFRALLTCEEQNGELVAVDFGATELAATVQSLLNVNNINDSTKKDIKQVFILRNYKQIKDYFIIVKNDERVMSTPIISSPQGGGLKLLSSIEFTSIQDFLDSLLTNN